MKSIKMKIAAGLIIVLLMIGFLSIFIVKESESALILRLGKIINRTQNNEPSLQGPGLHFKIPFIDDIRFFDMRTQELATPSSHPLTVVTKEQTYLLVEYFAKWKITNLAKFYTSTGGGSVSRAETLLEQRLNDIVRAEFGKHTSNQAISFDRTTMMNAIREQASNIGKDQGITVIDVRIQQISIPKEVMDSVFKRMAAERKQFAESKRAEGAEKSEEIRALADQKVTVIRAEALTKGAQTRARGDLAAADVYAKAFSANPDFYTYYRSLEAYENSFRDKSDVLILNPQGQFFNYFHNNTLKNTFTANH